MFEKKKSTYNSFTTLYEMKTSYKKLKFMSNEVARTIALIENEL